MPESRQLVENPLTFTPLPNGLLSVVTNPPLSDHWSKGVTFQANCLNSGNTTYDECISVTGTGSPPEPNSKSGTTSLELRGATPFSVYTEFDCSPVGIGDAQKVASQALERTTSWQVERAFWTGIADGQPVVFPHIAADSEVFDEDEVTLQTIPTTGSGPMDIAAGLGFLEQELADCYGASGVIHVSRNVLPTLVAWNLVDARGPQLRTKNGNLVAVGSGYPGTAPDGSDPATGNEWIYATGNVFAYVGETRIQSVPDSFDKANNTVKMIAERTYVLGWDCCHVGVEIILGVPTPA